MLVCVCVCVCACVCLCVCGYIFSFAQLIGMQFAPLIFISGLKQCTPLCLTAQRLFAVIELHWSRDLDQIQALYTAVSVADGGADMDAGCGQ